MKTIFKSLPNWYIGISSIGVLAFLLFLAYHDEGYNNWSWMQDAGSWVFMIIAWNVLFWFFIGLGVTLQYLVRSK
jgi:hypothetical protein